MRVLSIDVGIKHLAFCFIDIIDNNYNIILWKIIDISTTNKCSLCDSPPEYSWDNKMYCKPHAKENNLKIPTKKIMNIKQLSLDELVILAKKYKVMLVADSQSSSQTGDISRFNGMKLITPTEREARISTRNSEDGLIVLAEQLRQQSSAENILLKIGEEGVLIHANDSNDDDSWLTDRVRALNSAPRDVAGAGDSLLISSALTIATGGSIWEATLIGSLAAAIQVGRVGNTPLQSKEIFEELR